MLEVLVEHTLFSALPFACSCSSIVSFSSVIDTIPWKESVLVPSFDTIIETTKLLKLQKSSRSTMKRPELLMFALLRSSATALATTGEKLCFQTQNNIQLRLATRTDVPAIQRCNLACLPENYNHQFYISHLRQWPDLALVAEEISDYESPLEKAHADRQSRNPFSGFPGAHQEPKVVAYLLGKIETRPIMDYDNPTRDHGVEFLGHVTSLAVQQDYRRLGLAKAMMTQLHHHLQHQGIASCGLHVRSSNIAACRLYEDDGYQVSVGIIWSIVETNQKEIVQTQSICTCWQPYFLSSATGRKLDTIVLPGRRGRILYEKDFAHQWRSAPRQPTWIQHQFLFREESLAIGRSRDATAPGSPPSGKVGRRSRLFVAVIERGTVDWNNVRV